MGEKYVQRDINRQLVQLSCFLPQLNCTTQLFLAWPQLFPIMMATWQVWGPLLLLQVIKSIVILLLHFPSVKLFSDLALDVYKTSIDTLS